MSKKRIDAVRAQLQNENLDGLIVSHLDHIRYLSGFTGSAALLIITPKTAEFFTDFRYIDQAKKQVKGAKRNIITKDLSTSIKDNKKLNLKHGVYGYSSEYMTVGKLKQFESDLSATHLVEANEIFTELGWVKDADEIEDISKACAIGDLAFERVLNIVKPGIREREIAAELEFQMAMLGSEKPAFETIIASGYRSAMPHGVASDKKVKKGDFVTFDFGATVNGYVSDMTRTIVVGKATPKQKKIYNLVLKAQKASIRKIKAGANGRLVDAAGRNIITKAGYGKNFGHGTGHGIGYFVHVGPNLSPRIDVKLKVNNVVTVEPGIYISGWGGVRIEDDVVVTKTGGRILNKAEKKLLEL